MSVATAHAGWKIYDGNSWKASLPDILHRRVLTEKQLEGSMGAWHNLYLHWNAASHWNASSVTLDPLSEAKPRVPAYWIDPGERFRSGACRSAQEHGAERLAHFSASARRHRERNHAKDERQRGHQDRPQASTGGLNGCVAHRCASVFGLFSELDD